MNEKSVSKKQRIEYVDWLRVSAVLLLFPFHAGELFTPGSFYVKNQDVSTVIQFVNSLIHQWHMPLFMFLAGIGSRFALRFRGGKEYLVERTKRLFVPLLFGVLVIIPPQSYLRLFGDPEKVWPRGFSGNAPDPGYNEHFFQFYPSFFNGIFPNGNWEWGHLWFLAYLFTFSILALPLFRYLKGSRGMNLTSRLAGIAEKKGGLLLFALPIAVFELSLRWRYPGLQNLVADWANFLTYITLFIYGYVIVSNDRFLAAIDRWWKTALTAGIILDVVLAVHFVFLSPGSRGAAPYAAAMILRAATMWCGIVGFMGLGRRFMNRGGRFIDYAKEAALPYYMLHQTIVIAVGFYIVKLQIPAAAKYGAVVATSFAATAALYEFAVRRFPVARFLFGMKKKRPNAVSATTTEKYGSEAMTSESGRACRRKRRGR